MLFVAGFILLLLFGLSSIQHCVATPIATISTIHNIVAFKKNDSPFLWAICYGPLPVKSMTKQWTTSMPFQRPLLSLGGLPPIQTRIWIVFWAISMPSKYFLYHYYLPEYYNFFLFFPGNCYPYVIEKKLFDLTRQIFGLSVRHAVYHIRMVDSNEIAFFRKDNLKWVLLLPKNIGKMGKVKALYPIPATLAKAISADIIVCAIQYVSLILKTLFATSNVQKTLREFTKKFNKGNPYQC